MTGQKAAKRTDGPAFSEEDPFTVERYEQFYRFLPRGAASVLDVGCNTGRGGARLNELDAALKIGGLDCMQHRLDALPPCYTQKVYGLSTEIPLEDKSLDAIVQVSSSSIFIPMTWTGLWGSSKGS